MMGGTYTSNSYSCYDGWITNDSSSSTGDIYCKYEDATTMATKMYKEYMRGCWYDTSNSTNSSSSTWKTIKYGDAYATTITTNYEYDNWYWRWKEGEPTRVPSLSPQDRLKEIIQSRQTPLIIARRTPMKSATDIKEERARETLRRVLGEDKFRSYIRNGFVSVRARSGLVYQIFPGHGITAVYRDGQMMERLCVVLKGQFPPTDSLIMRYLLILNDEKDFRSHAIKHSVLSPKQREATIQHEPLTEIFRKLKVA